MKAKELRNMTPEDLAKKEALLMEKIYKNASAIVKSMAASENIQIVLVKSELTVLYANPQLDITNKVIVAYEDSLSWGIGSEISARIADELFPWLDGPVRRVASLDTWVAYAPQVEDRILPQTSDLVDAIAELHAY